MTRRAKLVIGGVIVVGIVVALFAAKGASGGQATEVRMEPVARRDLMAVVTASGQIQAKTDVDVTSEVQARILKIHVKEGDMVRKGDLLVELDQVQFKGAVDRAQAGLATAHAGEVQARASRDQSKRTLDRLKELKRLQPTQVTDQDMETAQQNFDIAEALLTSSSAQVQQAEAAVKESNDNLGRTRLFSEISGRVIRLPVEEGEVAIPGTFSKDQALLMRIADLSSILAKVKVDETDVVRLALHDSVSVTIDAFPDTTFIGRVTKIGNSATTAAATGGSADKAVDFQVEVTLVNPPRDVRPDLSMTARIITDVRKQALSIPIISLTTRAKDTLRNDTGQGAPLVTNPADTAGKKKAKEQEGVFVVTNGIARFRPVKVGIAGDEYFEVLEGVKEGEVIVSGTYQAIRDLKDSTRVKAAPSTGPNGAVAVKKP